MIYQVSMHIVLGDGVRMNVCYTSIWTVERLQLTTSVVFSQGTEARAEGLRARPLQEVHSNG